MQETQSRLAQKNCCSDRQNCSQKLCLQDPTASEPSLLLPHQQKILRSEMPHSTQKCIWRNRRHVLLLLEKNIKKKLYINEGAHCFSTFSLHNRKTTAMMRTLKHLLRQGHGTKIWKTLERKTKHFFSKICPSAKTCPIQVSRNRWEPCFKETRKHSWDSPAVHGHCYFAVHPKK